MGATMPDIDRWLDPDGAASYLKVRPDELRRLVREGKIPPASRQLGPRRPRWDRIALDLALAGDIRSPTTSSADAAVEALRARLNRRPRSPNRQEAAR